MDRGHRAFGRIPSPLNRRLSQTRVRLAILNGNARVVGGIETYLSVVLPALRGRGHELAILCESLLPADRAWVSDDSRIPRWGTGELGIEPSLDRLRAWHPDVVFAHGCRSVALEGAAAEVAPFVYFAHGYYGTCISGAKTHKWPAIEPCHRRFGAACLALYLPRRCGGLNPLTMWRQFLNERERLRVVRRARLVTVTSRAMAEEYRRHGVGDRVRVVHLPLTAPVGGHGPAELPAATHPVRLLFLGRMDVLKGGQHLLAALPRVRAALGRPIQLQMAGDGAHRARWELLANRMAARDPAVQIEFAGWVGEDERNELFRKTDLLVVPSVWPEPFGQVGLEACHFGVPSVAFAVGGIPDWLKDGVNGHLAPGDPPTPAGLANAIAHSLRDPIHHARLKAGALEAPRLFTMDRHLAELDAIFAEAAGHGIKAASPSAG